MEKAYKLVISEKPSVGKSIAAVLGANERKDGYFMGSGYIVSWCFGHLAELAEAAAYDEKYAKWRYDNLPILPESWQYSVARDKAKQLALLNTLMHREDVSEVINACDAGREGESIFRTVYLLNKCDKPMKRLWISSMEDTAIRKGFETLKDGSAYDDLYASALCRSKADWLVGINATRLFSVLYHRTLNVGRVVSPTLALIVQREAEIDAFKPEPFYTVTLGLPGIDAGSERMKSKADAETLCQSCANQTAVVTKLERKDKSEKPPALYDLTTLQRDANRILGFTAQQTLDYLQCLYEKKLCTYPRTDSRYLTSDMADGLPVLVSNVAATMPKVGGIQLHVNAAQVINDKKISDHHAIMTAIHEIAHSLLHGRDDVGEKYQVIELFEEPALYSNGRIDREKLPEGLYAYDLRGSDDDPGLPVTIQERVVVNHAATVITATPIDLTDAGYLPLGEDGLNFLGGEQTLKGFLHEHFPEKAKISRNTEEVQAESISYAVCAYFGIETGENSFGYIATWSKGKELPELKASLETINRTASGLITDIDRNYKALMKERGLDKEPESLAAEPVQEITVQEPEPVSAPDNGSVPDPAISVESMNAYGYTDSNMLPLTKERALELMERDVTVYMLHTDNTEAMAFDADEIRSFDGIFGVEASEWGTVKDRFVPQDYEKAFLDNPADSFAIYQLRDNDDTVQLHYMNSEYLEKKGLSIQKENYAAVYAGDLDRRGDTQDKLNELYETFNIRRPEDFRGHSLSVSDIVALKQNGVVSCHYVDSWGFKELPGFLKPENYLKNAEMAMEDDYGMIDGIINNGPRKTVAELEEQSKTGTPISLLELAQAVQREDAEKRRAQQPVRREKSDEKPSILAKLKTPSVADTKSVKSAPKRSAEREL